MIAPRITGGGWLVLLVAGAFPLAGQVTTPAVGHTVSDQRAHEVPPASTADLTLPVIAPGSAIREHVRSTFGKLPLHFEANTGQTDGEVKFLSRGGGYTLFLAPTEAVLAVAARKESAHTALPPSAAAAEGENNIDADVLRLRWLNANPNPRITGTEPQSGKSAYFIGNDPDRWRRDVPHFGKVHYEAVYPGIDLVYYGNRRQIEYDFVVAPGADPNQIRLAVQGADKIRLDSEGNLVLSTPRGDLLQHAPSLYQETGAERVPVEGRYVLHPDNEIGFEIAAYDPERELVIDPILQSTYLGGSDGDTAWSIAIHPVTGEIYVAGETISANFPGVLGGAQPALGGGAALDAFVARFNADLTVLGQATYLGGGAGDGAYSLVIHPVTGEAYIAGWTLSTNFPGTTGGAQGINAGSYDAFVARLNSSLNSLLQATYLGGTDVDGASFLTVHPATGEVYVAGTTNSTNLPGTTGGAQAIAGGSTDAFIARLNANLTAFLQATYLGGSAGDFSNALTVHPATGEVYVAGTTDSTDLPGTTGGAQATYGGGISGDAFVARLNANLTGLLQSTYLGGADVDGGYSLAIHPATGEVYAGGDTLSTNFPGTVNGAQPTNQGAGNGSNNGFIARLNINLTGLLQATYLGGSGFNDLIRALAIHPGTGEVYAGGRTESTDFPGTAGGAQALPGGDGWDGFVARLNANLTGLLQSTYLGGAAPDQIGSLVLRPSTGQIYVAGYTSSTVFPNTTGGAQSVFGGGTSPGDAFITRLTDDLAAVNADLALVHTGAPDPVFVGNNLTYTITVTNNGNSSASNVAVTDTLPASTNYVSAAATQGNCIQSLGVVSCALGTLAVSASAAVTVVVTPTVSGTLTSNASVSATEPDPNAANNSVLLNVTASATTGTLCNTMTVFARAFNRNCSVFITTSGGSSTGGSGALHGWELLAGLLLLAWRRILARRQACPRGHFLLAVFALMLTGPARADDDLARLNALIAERRYAEAYPLAESLQQAYAGHPSYDYAYGLSALEAGKPNLAIFALHRVLMKEPANDRARLDLARAYLGAGQVTAARAELHTLLAHHPAPELASEARDYLNQTSVRKTSRTRAALELAVGHDSNANSGIGTATLPPAPGAVLILDPSTQAQADTFTRLAAEFSTQQPAGSGYWLLGLNGYHHMNRDHHRFDTTVTNLFAGGGQLFGEGRLSAYLARQQLQVEWDDYLLFNSLIVEWRQQLDPHHSVALLGQTGKYAYGTLPQRDADSQQLILRWQGQLAVDGQPRLTASVYRGQDRTHDSAYSYYGRRYLGVQMEGRFVVSEHHTPYLSLRAQNSGHDAQDPIYLTAREDSYKRLVLGHYWQMHPHLGWRLELDRATNRSNVALYEFVRTQLAVSARYDFF